MSTKFKCICFLAVVAKLLHSPVLSVVCERDILMKILKTALCWQCLRTDQPESSDCTEVLERERETEKAVHQLLFSSLFAGQLNKQTNKMEKFEGDWCMHFVVRLESAKLPGWNIVTIKPFSSE